MRIVAVIFAIDHFGAEFQVKIEDCVNGIDFDVKDVVESKIIFYKPNGFKFEKPATIEADVRTGEKYITYSNTTPEVESILNYVGKWQFAAQVRLSDNDSFETSQRSIFWVQ